MYNLLAEVKRFPPATSMNHDRLWWVYRMQAVVAQDLRQFGADVTDAGQI
jgi:hypothetical protein